MISLAALIGFVLTSLIIESTPGPNMGYLAILSISKGKRAGYAAVAGIALGLLIVGLAAALGLAAIISNSPFLYQALRIGGVVYMLYLAWEGWRGEAAEDFDAKVRRRDGVYFRRGLIVNLLNPKAAVFYIAVLPSFIDMNEVVLQQAVILTFMFVAVASFIHMFIVTLAGSMRPFLENPRYEMIIRRTLALLLAVVAFWFGYKTRL